MAVTRQELLATLPNMDIMAESESTLHTVQHNLPFRSSARIGLTRIPPRGKSRDRRHVIACDGSCAHGEHLLLEAQRVIERLDPPLGLRRCLALQVKVTLRAHRETAVRQRGAATETVLACEG